MNYHSSFTPIAMLILEPNVIAIAAIRPVVLLRHTLPAKNNMVGEEHLASHDCRFVSLREDRISWM
jgi:hypothetical protein